MVKLHLLVLRCADLARSRRFYEGLGLSFVEEQHGAGPRHLAAILPEGLVIELYPASASHPVNNIRLGFEVTDVEGTAVVEDPDGRKIELRQPG